MLFFQFSFAQTPAEKLDNWLHREIKDLGGRAVLGIYQDGKWKYQHTVNELLPRQKLAMKYVARKAGNDSKAALEDFDTAKVVPIASCSKWLSAALVMTFVDDGSLKLEDSIGKYLPARILHGKGGIKIWQCLSHMTGINTGKLKENLDLIRQSGNMLAAAESICKLPIESEPGESFHYSNAGLQLAAAVVEVVGGKSFKALFAERITRPLGMHQTNFGNAVVPLAAGGINSTTADYMRFLSMILGKGLYNGKRILSEESIRLMHINRMTPEVKIIYTPAEAQGWGYGFGVWVAPLCTAMPVGVGGGMPCIDKEEPSYFVSSPGLFGSFPWIDTDQNYAGFLMTFGFKSSGRALRYQELKQLVEEVLPAL